MKKKRLPGKKPSASNDASTIALPNAFAAAFMSPDTLKAWDQHHVWHPFTPMSEYADGDEAVVVERGEGVRLQDVDGNWYYDGVSSVWLNVHGHNVPALNEAITEQLGKVAHSTLLGQGNVPATRLAKRLADASPDGGLQHVFYSDSGATAVEIALKTAIQFWANHGREEKRQVMGFTHNYHGDTLGAMTVAPDETFHWPFLHLLPERPRAPYPYAYRCPFDTDTASGCRDAALEETGRLLDEHADQLAALIVEPVEGAGGMIPAPEGFLAGLRALCDEHDVLLIVDEVATGFGRTGPLFACDSEGVTPDLMCLGKGLTGGYLPVAATLATGDVYDAFLGERDNALYHGHSYTGNQLGCAVALRSLDLLEDLLPTLPDKIALIEERLAPLAEHPFGGDVRQRGFMCGLELVADRDTKARFPWKAQPGYAVSEAARDHGLLLRPIGSTVIFMPPLASTEEELHAMLDRLEAAFDDARPALRTLAEDALAGTVA